MNKSARTIGDHATMKFQFALLSGLILAMLTGCVADYGDSGPAAGGTGTETPVTVWYATDRARDDAAGGANTKAR
jgi:hypothetical protein